MQNVTKLRKLAKFMTQGVNAKGIKVVLKKMFVMHRNELDGLIRPLFWSKVVKDCRQVSKSYTKELWKIVLPFIKHELNSWP